MNKYLQIGYSAQDFYTNALNLLAEHKDVPDDIFKSATFSKPVLKYATYAKIETKCYGVANYKIMKSEEVPTGNYTVQEYSNGKTVRIAEKKTEHTYRNASKNYNVAFQIIVSLDVLADSASVTEIGDAYADKFNSKKERESAKGKLESLTSAVVKGSLLTELENKFASSEISSSVVQKFGARLNIIPVHDKIEVLIGSECGRIIRDRIELNTNETVSKCDREGNIEIVSVTYYVIPQFTMEYLYKGTKYLITQEEFSSEINLNKIPKPDGWANNNPKTKAFLHVSVLAPLIAGSVLFLIYVLLSTLEIGGDMAMYALALPAVALFVVCGVFFAKRLKSARTNVADTKKQDLKRLLENLSDGDF